MFDNVEIRIKPGEGGDGSVSFRREKFVPYGGPDGGDGGNGGNIIVVADPGLSSLRHFKYNKLYKAGKGDNGLGQKKHGKNGDDLILKVPAGTVVLDMSRPFEERMIADCREPGQREVIVRGGHGGKGNVHYASSTDQAPRIAQKGETTSEMTVTLEMRLIADVGIIGYPNAGKSTLLSTASAAKPKIADYPFTTLEPILGVVEVGLKTFIIAEIPGLIEGAHTGKGLGHDFLRHIMRTKILIHLVDGRSESPVEDMVRVNTELALFDAELAKRPQIVAVNKTDLPDVHERIEAIRQSFNDTGVAVEFISAETGSGVSGLMGKALKTLEEAGAALETERKLPKAVFRPQPRERSITVQREGDVFVLTAPDLERIVARVDTADYEVRRQVLRRLGRPRIRRTLEKAGIQPGDKIRCGEFEWEW